MGTLDLVIYILFLLTGFFALIASVFNFDWYFNARQAQTFVGWFGRTGARIFYGLLGIALLLCGCSGIFGWA